MFKRRTLLLIGCCFLVQYLSAQTTNGSISGVTVDSSQAIIGDVTIEVTNQDTRSLRTVVTDSHGYYTVPQLPPGSYSIKVTKQSFATILRSNIQLQVNQNATLDFILPVASVAQTIQITGAPPALNTTSATLETVIDHKTTVDLPLNGREFTQLTLLTPGAVAQQTNQQSTFTVALGTGGISPSVNGQSSLQNNFTMDGLLNNQLYTDSWAISPPPDALQEFNVQSHMTDAQFSISSGANINVSTRSGTDSFHGAVWEFLRNSALDAQQFPQTERQPYRQNQYGVYLGGPVHKGDTWFSGYWEGFRSAQDLTYLGSTLTSAMRAGDFSALLGPQIGTDSLGRPELANEIYDPATSRPDPLNPGSIIRDPFPGNQIPTDRISPAATPILQKYYPLPNLSVGPAVLPNLSYSGSNSTASDNTGIRIDHHFANNDSLFGRYQRSNINLNQPAGLPSPGYFLTTNNYAQSYAVGYTHLIGGSTIINLRYGYLKANLSYGQTPAGADIRTAFNIDQAFPIKEGLELGPEIALSNGYNGVGNIRYALGPDEGNQYNVDVSKTKGKHTLSAGAMLYYVHTFDDGWNYDLAFTQNATSQAAQLGSTGMGPASFLLGLPDSISAYLGNSAADLNVSWYAGYVQDQWQATQKLSISAGLRYDYVSPPNYHKIITGLDITTGQFLTTGPVLPLYPQTTAPKGWYYPQHNGYQPRFGIAYQASRRTVLQSAFAVLDNHNDTLIAQYQFIRQPWPVAALANVTLLNRAQPTLLMTQLPNESTFFDPNVPQNGASGDPHDKIAYSMQYNAGVEQQLTNTMVLSLAYVGASNRHMFLENTANTAMTPGPGSLASRGQPFPQFGPFVWGATMGSSSYNGFQAELKKSLASGLSFLASYTWSKSLDISDSWQAGEIQNFYDLRGNWGPSDINRSQIFVLSGVYALPVGQGKTFSGNQNRIFRAITDDWNIGTIINLVAGAPFNASAGGDVANVGGGAQRANKIGDAYSGTGFHQSPQSWINRGSFAVPTQYTFGNEGRNDLVGPTYKNVDFNAFRDFPLRESLKLEFRTEFFNLFNHTNYALPNANVQSSAFGQITAASGPPRQIQFAAKILF
jgi:Carboxypeptidase regulatory-like domain